MKAIEKNPKKTKKWTGPVVNEDRLKQDIFQLSRIGLNETDQGVNRVAFSEADMEGRKWLMEQIEVAGFTARMDGAGNVFGGMEWQEDDHPVILLGSHLDSVPSGGALDGALGVLAALECLRIIKEQGIKTQYPVELVAFSDEEGRFGGMFGSQAMVGDVTPEKIFTATDADGIFLKDIMTDRGMQPMQALDARRDPETVQAYLELHIEQGPVLDHLKKQVGVVEGIAGLFKWQVRLKGAANHEGTTPMDMRNDAFLALADFAHEIPRVLDENGTPYSRATIGKVELVPGFPHTIPGEVDFTLVARDISAEVMNELEIAFRKALSAIARKSALMFEFDVISRIEPTMCDKEIFEAIDKTARKMYLKKHKMYSGAGHDAQFVAQIAPIGMIFVPSKNGISHSPAEWTDWQDIFNGANLLLNTMLQLAGTA